MKDWNLFFIFLILLLGQANTFTLPQTKEFRLDKNYYVEKPPFIPSWKYLDNSKRAWSPLGPDPQSPSFSFNGDMRVISKLRRLMANSNPLAAFG